MSPSSTATEEPDIGPAAYPPDYPLSQTTSDDSAPHHVNAYEEPESSQIPMHHQRPFGAGLKRKRHVAFVRATSPERIQALITKRTLTGEEVRNRYLGIVLGEDKPVREHDASSDATNGNSTGTTQDYTCTTCPPSAAQEPAHIHARSITHQLSLPHSHPPSHVDRGRYGLAILQSHGWDPDARVGLGRDGEGRTAPIKVMQKEGKEGVGVVLPKQSSKATVKEGDGTKKGVTRAAKKPSRAELLRQEQAKAARWRSLVYGDDKVNQYLGVEL